MVAKTPGIPIAPPASPGDAFLDPGTSASAMTPDEALSRLLAELRLSTPGGAGARC